MPSSVLLENDNFLVKKRLFCKLRFTFQPFFSHFWQDYKNEHRQKEEKAASFRLNIIFKKLIFLLKITLQNDIYLL